MFGFGQKNKMHKKSKTDKRQKKPNKAQASCAKGECTGKAHKGKKSESQRIREEALANARAAREAIGEETIQKIAAAMAKKENSPMAIAKRQLENADSERVADEIFYMLDD